MAKNKKIDLISLIILGVLVVSLVMVIVGICITWTTATSLGGKTITATLSDWTEANGKAKDGLEGFGVMQAFAYITLVLTILTTLAFVVSKFVDVKILKWVVVGIAALTVVSAIVLIATTYSFCSKDVVKLVNLSEEVAPAAGAWLATIFAVVAGAAGAVGALKK